MVVALLCIFYTMVAKNYVDIAIRSIGRRRKLVIK
ncbi:hypothetical protein YYY_06035 [Anaplasma phagocytophilum str. Dog2]|nr:hypothetical protein YYY_06035 [Anaplasma phagocytophilum str. Dog2]